MKIKGAVLRKIPYERPYKETKPLDVTEVELKGPGDTELLVRIEAAGICHSDLSVLNGDRVRPVPMLLGHESAGIVEKVGKDITDINVGDRVVTVFLPRCEECENCKTGGKLPCIPGTKTNNEGVLPSGDILLSDENGEIKHHLGVSCFATHAVVDRKSVVPVGSDVPPEVAAVLGCAVLTGGGAIKNAGDLQPGQDVIIVGLGGVGFSSVLTALAVTGEAGGKVIGVDFNEEKLQVAKDMGAHETYTPTEAIEASLKAPVVIEAAGNAKAFETAVKLTAPGGITVTVGLPAPDATANIVPLGITAEARTIIGSYLGSAIPARDIPEYEKMWRDGILPVEKLISTKISLDEINEAMDNLSDGKAIRQIITF